MYRIKWILKKKSFLFKAVVEGRNRSIIDMIFVLQQLQDNCRDQRQPFYLAVIDLTKAFDLVSRDALLRLLPLEAFRDGMMESVQYDNSTSTKHLAHKVVCSYDVF